MASIAGVSEQVVAEVVEHFRQPGCNFLVATPQTPLTGKTTLDISHEALLRQWAKLGKWLDEEAKSAADYCRLEADARSWQKKRKAFFNLRNWTSPSKRNRNGLLNGRGDTEPILISQCDI